MELLKPTDRPLNDSVGNSSKITSDVRAEEDAMEAEFYGDKKDQKPRLQLDESMPTAPMSPGKKMLYYAGSPGRFV